MHVLLLVPTCYIEPFNTGIEITFQWNSGEKLGPLPHGYEVVVWQEGRDDTKKVKSVNYFPAVTLSTYRVIVDGLTSNMTYLVQVRANGSHIPNMKSAWVETRIQTLAHGELMHICMLENQSQDACATSLFHQYQVTCVWTISNLQIIGGKL